MRLASPAELAAVCVLTAFFWGGPADAKFLGFGKNKSEIPPGAIDQAAGIAYRTHFEGLAGTKLEPLLKGVSDLVIRADQKPLSRAALERRAQEDLGRLKAALDSEGYYAASLRAAVDYTTEPAVVRIVVDLGTRFTIERFSIQYTDEREGELAPLPRDAEGFGVPVGAPARAAAVLAAQEKLVRHLQSTGFPLVAMADHRYIVDMADNKMTVDVVFTLHGAWRFGPVRIEGAPSVSPGYIERRKPWKDGDPFDRSELDLYRRRIEETSLFRRVRVSPAEPAMAEGDLLPVLVSLDPRPHRTVGVGVKYATDEGFGGKVFWQNRNLFGRARSLELAATVAETRQALDGTYRQPEFWRPDQTLVIRSELANESTDAFNKRGVVSSAILDRKIRKYLTLSGGAELEVSHIEDTTGPTSVQLVSFPLAAAWDSSNDALDPVRGLRARLEVTPSTGNADGAVTFVTIQATASGYLSIVKQPQTILALRGRIGSIVGQKTNEIPADRRFYAGGGGSLRGYAYRNAGPLDINNDPVGGRSVLEAAAEFRVRVSESFGVVPFVEAGNVYDTSLPRRPQSLFVSAGLGFRYYSPIGPVRLDVGVPLNRRRDVDAPVQLYVSLGQAF